MARQTLALNTTNKLYENTAGFPKASYQFVYDFSVLGGATGTIPLTASDGALPNNFVVQNVLVDMITGLIGGVGSTVALTTGQTVNDLVAATVVAGAPWSTTGLKATLVLMGTIATLIKTTSTRSPAIVVAVNALTAGKFNVFIEGYFSS